MKERVEIVCKNCGRRFSVLPSRQNRQFCSIYCKAQYYAKKQNKILKCANCGKEFLRPQCFIKEKQHVFCCNECRLQFKMKQKISNLQRQISEIETRIYELEKQKEENNGNIEA